VTIGHTGCVLEGLHQPVVRSRALDVPVVAVEHELGRLHVIDVRLLTEIEDHVAVLGVDGGGGLGVDHPGGKRVGVVEGHTDLGGAGGGAGGDGLVGWTARCSSPGGELHLLNKISVGRGSKLTPLLRIAIHIIDVQRAVHHGQRGTVGEGSGDGNVGLDELDRLTERESDLDFVILKGDERQSLAGQLVEF
jgi:hypothetical protein